MEQGMTDYFGYSGKVAVVTGAASGMGRALSEILVDLGADVYALDRVESPVEGIARSIIADLGRKDSIDEAFTQIPDSIDAFFGVAGVSGVTTSFVDTITINFVSNAYIGDAYLTDRLTEGGSLTVVTSNGGLRWETPEVLEETAALVHETGWDALVAKAAALNAELGGIPGPIGYIVSKRALNLWVAEQVLPFAELRKIRVNAVLPAMTVSGMLPEFTQMKGGVDAVNADLGPGGRLAESVDMGRVLAFLGSDLASYVSGAHLSVDYGANSLQLIGLSPDRGRWTLHDRFAPQPTA
jgi:NAD(P)-dependent dehydrogenase (short-subunit alcohol dehydrogenase family)